MAGVARSGFQALANAVWSLVAVASRTVRVVRSVQYLSTLLDENTTSDQISPGTAFTDYTKVVVIPATSLLVNAALGGFYNMRWQVVSNTNVTVHHNAPGGTGSALQIAAAFAVEFY